MKILPAALSWVLLIMMSPAISVYADDGLILPQEEAPDSILDIDLASGMVDLMILGSWEASLYGGIGYRTVPGTSGLIPAAFPGLSSG